MADPARKLAADIGMAVAHAILKSLPEARAMAKDGNRIDQAIKVTLLRDRTGALRCRISVGPPRPQIRPQRLTVSLDEDQLGLFGG